MIIARDWVIKCTDCLRRRSNLTHLAASWVVRSCDYPRFLSLDAFAAINDQPVGWRKLAIVVVLGRHSPSPGVGSRQHSLATDCMQVISIYHYF